MPSSASWSARLAASVLVVTPLFAQPLVIDTAVVGNPGNAGHPNRPGVGAVADVYHIGTYEVTNAQYAHFLNQVAASDPFGLYNPDMGPATRGGIVRSGSSGAFTYAVKDGAANKPVLFVDFWDAARFVNWLATGHTEGRVDGASPLLPGAAYDTNFVANPTIGPGSGRLPGATVFLPSYNEWYKAAFHQPADAGGDPRNYWDFATRSNTQPTSAPPGPGVGRANYVYNDGVDNGVNGGFAVTQDTAYPAFSGPINPLTDVGAYGAGSSSFWGTSDQNGNVAEWVDTVYAFTNPLFEYIDGEPVFVGEETTYSFLNFGGAWHHSETFLWHGGPAGFLSDTGFRVASLTAIPEPGVYAAALGAAALAVVRWRGRRVSRLRTAERP